MRSLVRESIETVLLALAIYVVLQFSVQPYRVEGVSMSPGLEQGEYLLVNKVVYWNLPVIGGEDGYLVHPPVRGDIVVFKFPHDSSRSFVKRIIGVPGDTIQIHRGTVFVNGNAIDEPYVASLDHGNFKPVVVPHNSYFVLGDNRTASDDSRSWGMVPQKDVIGRAWVSYWPADRLRDLLAFN